jgi:phosphinothricin acetyltransferase
MEIVAAAAAHAAAIADIYNEAVVNTVATFETEPRGEAQMAQWLAAHDSRHPVMVALDAGRVIGWASLSLWSDRGAYRDTGEISVYVRQGLRGRGTGRMLMEQVLAAGREAGLHTVLARIAGDNAASVRLHERAGFELVGVMREVGHKLGRWVDVRLMQLML